MSSVFALEGLASIAEEDAAVYPTALVEVDWDNDGVYEGGDEDVTDDVLSVDTFAGRDLANQLTGKAVAGTLRMILDNQAGTYSPFNTSSPLTGNLLPRRPVRVRITTPVARTLWAGFIDQIRPIVQADHLNLVEITALGSLSALSETDVRVEMQTSVLTGSGAIAEILDQIDWPAADRDLDAGQTTMDRWFTDTLRALTAAREVEATEAGFLRETPDGDIAFEGRQHRLAEPHTIAQAAFTDAAGAALNYLGIQEIDSSSLIFNDFRSSVRKFTVGALAVLWTDPECDTSGDAPEISPGQSITRWAGYPNPASATDAVGVDAWTTPVVTTDYTANSASNGTGSDLSADVGIAVSKFSNAMKITVTNNGSTSMFITLLQARGTPVTISDPTTVFAEDATSQTRHGVRTYPRPAEAKFVPDTVEAQSWCDLQIGVYKDPIAVLSLTLSANSNAYRSRAALDRDVSDRVSVAASTIAKLGIDGGFFVEAVRHSIRPGKFHNVTLDLSDAEQFSDFWILGTSALDTQTRLGY